MSPDWSLKLDDGGGEKLDTSEDFRAVAARMLSLHLLCFPSISQEELQPEWKPMYPPRSDSTGSTITKLSFIMCGHAKMCKETACDFSQRVNFIRCADLCRRLNSLIRPLHLIGVWLRARLHHGP